MSGRPCRPPPIPDGAALDPRAERKTVLSRIHDAAQVGDADALKGLFDAHPEIHVNYFRRGRNTALHTALLHNQEGPLIDYLIRSGANLEALNTKGYSPLALAIIHCRGSRAVSKLIAAGARWERFDGGAFAGLSARDVAERYERGNVIEFLDLLAAGDVCRKSPSEALPRGRAICPICHARVKFPTKMSRIAQDQAEVERRIARNGDPGTRNKKYIARKYMDQLLAHSGGRA